MKRIVTSLLFAVSLALGISSANQANLFSVNEAELGARFEQLASVENDLADISDANGLMLMNPTAYYKISNSNASAGFTINDMDWGAFAWGFCCCPIGFFVVAINDKKDNNSKTSFWIGWGTGVILNLLSYAVMPRTYYVAN